MPDQLPTSPSQKTKVLFVITKSNFGGAQRYVFDLATRLPAKEFDTCVAFGGEGALKQKLEELGIRTLAIKGLGRDVRFLSDIQAFISLVSLFRREQPRIIHLNSSKAGFIGGLAARAFNGEIFIFNHSLSLLQKTFAHSLKLKTIGHRQKTKTVFTAHGWAFNEERGSSAKFFIKFLQWLTVLLTDMTIAVSDTTKKDMASWPCMPKKIITIKNGIASETMLERDIARKALMEQNASLADHVRHIALKDKVIWIGTASELHKNKGLVYMIDACASLARVTDLSHFLFLIMGNGEERAALEDRVRARRLEHNIFFLGHMPRAVSYLKAFDIFTLTSITEALPYALLEAGAASCSTVASSVGGIPEIIHDMESGILVRPRKSKDIAHALQFLFTHPEKRKQMGGSLRKHVMSEFKLTVMTNRTIEEYKKLIS